MSSTNLEEYIQKLQNSNDTEYILTLFSNILLELYEYLLHNKLNILTNTDIFEKCKSKKITDIDSIIQNYFNLNLINEILNLYKQKISIHIRYENIALNNYFYNLLVKAIIYYYEYYYYIYIIITQKNATHKTIGSIIVSHYNSIFIDEPIDISKITEPTKKQNLMCRMLKIKTKNIKYCIEKYLLYSYILYNFYKFITTVNNSESDIDIDIVDEYIIADYIGKFPITNIYTNNTEIIIVNFINAIKEIFIIGINKNSYITIPQYEKICWLISFITCITFSDESNILLGNKTYQYTAPRNFTLKDRNYYNDNPSDTLNILIYYIKNYVYKKTYNNLGNDECKILLILKHLPIRFLIQLYNFHFETINENKDEIESESFMKDTYKYSTLYSNNLNYLNNFYLKKNEKIEDVDIFDYILGIKTEDLIIYKEIYKLLNINALYLYKKNQHLYIKSLNMQSELENIPDVILIQILSYNEDNPLDKYISIIHLSKGLSNNIGDLEITYKDNIYVLDYIIFLTNNNHTNQNIGHAISCIKYNKTEYYYDQRFILSSKTCFDDISTDSSINFSCPLIEQKWTDKLEQEKHFCLNKCHLREINPLDDIHLITKDNSSEELCYSFNNNYILGYVKKYISSTTTKTMGGYKSINKKIKLFINNNHIERTIYINKDGLKYIRIKNKYILLKNYQ